VNTAAKVEVVKCLDVVLSVRWGDEMVAIKIEQFRT
jgi:hypothetical protein